MKTWSNGEYTVKLTLNSPNIIVKWVSAPADTKTQALHHIENMQQIVNANA